MSVINTNITSMISQKNLNTSKNSLTTAMERLSSGMRINSAKDDAAGQAIANRMTSQVRGLAQAQRNANDGISVAQTAEGALNQINDNLQRIRELTVQSANGTNSKDDLTSIQNEIGQRLNEINRISEETSFNGVKVLATDEGLKIQVGANDGETISVGLKKINVSTLNLSGFNVDGNGKVANAAASKDDLLLAGFVKGAGNDYTKANANSAATSADLFGKLENGSVVTSTSLANGFNTAATAYTYDKSSNSFSFGVNGVSKADTASYLTPAAAGEYTYATINIDNNPSGEGSIEVRIDSQGNIDTKDGKALYLDDTGNLTQNTAGTPTRATLEQLSLSMSGVNAPVAPALNINQGDGSTTETAQVTFSALTAGQSVTVGDVTLTAAGDLSANDVAAAFSGFINSDASTANATFTNASGSVITGAGSTNLKAAWGAASATLSGSAVTFTSATANTNVADLTVAASNTAGTGGSIKVGDTILTADTGTRSFNVTGAKIGAVQLANVVKTDGGTVDLDGAGAAAAYTVNAGGEVAGTYVDAKGALTASASATYYTHDNGNVTDASANQVFKNADGKLTFEATTAGSRTDKPLEVLDAALNMVDSLRSDLGAIQNRFESAITNLKTNETNLSAARSRIEDADYAVEVANMTRAQILQQAGTSVLAQANQVPQGVLSLLR